MKLCKKIVTLALTSVMVVGAILTPVEKASAVSSEEQHSCLHCKAVYGYAVPMRFVVAKNNYKCPTCGPTTVRLFQCNTCSDRCAIIVCQNGHTFTGKG